MRHATIILPILFLAACGGDGETGEAAAPAPAASTSDATVLAKLEAEGALPALDRSNSLQGTDQNNDGIRDDIAKIIDSMTFSAEQKNGLKGYARSLQQTLATPVNDVSKLEAAQKESVRALQCAVKPFEAQNGVGDALASTENLRELTLNTSDRVAAYLRYSDALDGNVIQLAEVPNCA